MLHLIELPTRLLPRPFPIITIESTPNVSLGNYNSRRKK